MLALARNLDVCETRSISFCHRPIGSSARSASIILSRISGFQSAAGTPGGAPRRSVRAVMFGLIA